MKISVILFCILFLTNIDVMGQNNTISGYAGYAKSSFIRHVSLDGDAEYDNSNSYEYGIKYSRTISDKISIETGLNYFSTDVKITPAFTGEPVPPRHETLQVTSVPLFLNISLNKTFYINGGPIFSFQNNETSIDSQSGIGYGIGVGGQYALNNIIFYINPNFKRNTILPFKTGQYYLRLTHFNIDIGLGYRF